MLSRPYPVASTSTPGVSTTVCASTFWSGNSARRASFSSFTSGCSSARSVKPRLSRRLPQRRARLRLVSVTTSTEWGSAAFARSAAASPASLAA